MQEGGFEALMELVRKAFDKSDLVIGQDQPGSGDWTYHRGLLRALETAESSRPAHHRRRVGVEMIPLITGCFTNDAAEAERCKAKGNAAFKAGELELACNQYAVSCCPLGYQLHAANTWLPRRYTLGVEHLRGEIFGGEEVLERYTSHPGSE